MTDRVYSWVRLSDTVWEHEPSGSKLVLDGGEWCVRFPNTTAVSWTVEDAMAMMHVMLGRPLIDAAKLDALVWRVAKATKTLPSGPPASV